MSAAEHNSAGRATSCLFHPFELAICGYRNSGKTTLTERLIRALAGEFRVGYVKHDGHAFAMDHEGKDTQRAAAAGASAVWINDATHTARIDFAPAGKFERWMALREQDVVLIEGYKGEQVPKLALFDPAGALLAAGVPDVVAWAGPDAQRPAALAADPAARDLPYFCRDDIEGLRAFVVGIWRERVRATPLYGLVLTGGRSRRMAADKARLAYHGVSQTRYMVDLLAPRTARVFVSTRADQAGDPERADLPQIHDAFLDMGPLGGILSALRAHPDAAWLVVACDLPYLEPAALDALLTARQPFKMATAFTSAHDGLPEPLCAVYEPKAVYRLCQFLGLGYTCPRKVMINSEVRLLAQANPKWLDNVNTPGEYQAALAELVRR